MICLDPTRHNQNSIKKKIKINFSQSWCLQTSYKILVKEMYRRAESLTYHAPSFCDTGLLIFCIWSGLRCDIKFHPLLGSGSLFLQLVFQMKKWGMWTARALCGMFWRGQKLLTSALAKIPDLRTTAILCKLVIFRPNMEMLVAVTRSTGKWIPRWSLKLLTPTYITPDYIFTFGPAHRVETPRTTQEPSKDVSLMRTISTNP